MHTAEYVTQERAAPAVLTIAIHLALIYMLAAGLGVVPSPVPQKLITLIDVPMEKVKPPPVETQPIDRRELMFGNTYIPVSNGPPIAIDDEKDPPSGNPPREERFGTIDLPVEPPITNARVLRSPEPPYPSFSRLSEEEGTVFVKVSISPYGVVGDATIEKSSGFVRLDEAALKAVRTWRFAPATRGTQAISMWVVVPVKYVLNGRG